MARVKKTVMQRSFTFMEVREDFLEGDDTEIRQASVQSARNMRALASRAGEARPGTFFIRNSTDARDMVEIRPDSDLKYGLVIGDDFLEIIDTTGFKVKEITVVPWSADSIVWVEPFRDETIIGGDFGLYTLSYDSGSWSLTEFAFQEASQGELAQPYWVFEKGVSITPSGTTGTINVTASRGIWRPEHVGVRIRYNFREILITEFLTKTTVKGDVINELPPTWKIPVKDSSGFRVGEAVVGSEGRFEGVIVDIEGNNLICVTLEGFEGPEYSDLGGQVIAIESERSKIQPGKKIVTPRESTIWDEALISNARGYPRAASAASGRLMFMNFPEAPNAIAVSSSRAYDDFKVGAEDDDAIARAVGDNIPRWLHAVNMGDVVLFADNGVYYLPTRDNGVLTPSTFNVVLVDEVGANEVPPVKVEDGIVFVEASGERVSAALLDGNVYLKWSIRAMTTYHDHLIKNPVKLCGPSLGAGITEKYVFVVNDDGTMAAVSWQESVTNEQVGFAPWDTEGSFISVSPMFGGYWALVDREVEGGTQRMIERFSTDAYLDSTVLASSVSGYEDLQVNGADLIVNGDTLRVVTPAPQHLPGMTVTIYSDGWDAGDFIVNSDGTMDDEPDFEGERQIGLNFVSELQPWPTEFIESPRIGLLKARVIEALISVQDTLGFEAVMNNSTRTIGAYAMGDDLSAPPVPRTKVYRFLIYGNRDHPVIKFRKTRPGPFRVLAIGQEVQG